MQMELGKLKIDAPVYGVVLTLLMLSWCISAAMTPFRSKE